FQIGQQITAENGPYQPCGERHGDLQAAVARTLLQLILRQEQNPEVPEAKRIQGHGVGLMILSEPTSTAGPRREVDVLVDHCVLALLRLFGLEKVDQVPSNKRRRTARADVDQLFPSVQVRSRYIGEGFSLIVQVVEDTLNQAFVLPRQPPIEHGHGAALVPRKWARRVGRIVRDSICMHCLPLFPCLWPHDSGPEWALLSY